MRKQRKYQQLENKEIQKGIKIGNDRGGDNKQRKGQIKEKERKGKIIKRKVYALH